MFQVDSGIRASRLAWLVPRKGLESGDFEGMARSEKPAKLSRLASIRTTAQTDRSIDLMEARSLDGRQKTADEVDVGERST